MFSCESGGQLLVITRVINHMEEAHIYKLQKTLESSSKHWNFLNQWQLHPGTTFKRKFTFWEVRETISEMILNSRSQRLGMPGHLTRWHLPVCIARELRRYVYLLKVTTQGWLRAQARPHFSRLFPWSGVWTTSVRITQLTCYKSQISGHHHASNI